MRETLGRLVRLANSKPFKKGFTLTELLVVVLVIGVLAAVAVPSYTKSVKKSRASDALNNLNIVSLKQQDFMLNNEKYAETFTELNAPISGLTGEAKATSGNFEYTLSDACVYANSNAAEKYQLIKNVDTEEVGCMNVGEETFCDLISDIVPLKSAEDMNCPYVAPNDDGNSGIGGEGKDCGDCSKTCSDGTVITAPCNQQTGACDWANAPGCPNTNSVCNNGTTKTEDGCIFVCQNDTWAYDRPADGYTGYNSSTGKCYKNACPEGTLQKNTVDGKHYCRTYTMGAWVPAGWTQECA